jgi:hemolysin activation/secretion protein
MTKMYINQAQFFSRRLNQSMRLIAALLYGCCFSSNAFAVDAGSVLKQQTDLDTRRELPTSIPENLIEDEVPQASSPSDLKIRILRFEFEGSITSVKKDELQDLVSPYEGKTLTFSEIQAVAKLITKLYASKGFFLASAIVPKQEVVDGVIKILINEGSLDPTDPIRIKSNQLRLKEESVKDYFSGAVKGGALKQSALERSILNLNDNPGITSSANLEPGSKPGTTRVVMDVNEGPLLDATVTADNYGGRYTGSDRLSATANLNNPSRYGDKLSLLAVTAVEQKFDLFKLSYALPLGRSGLRANVSYTDLNYELGKEFRNDDSIGQARNWTYGLKYPLYRTAMTSLTVGGAYDWKSNYNESAGATVSDKQINVYNASLTLENVDKVFGGGFTQVQLTQYTGDLDLGRFKSSDTARTSGQYQKTGAQLLRIQRGTERLSFQFLANGQTAQRNLDGSEKIILGGPAGIRAYPAGEGAGDEGYRYSLDARYVLATGTKLGDFVLSTFYDYGKIWQYQNSSLITGLTNNSYSLEGWGIGLDMIAAGKYSVKAGWAKPIGNNPARTAEGKDSDGTSRDSRFWLMGTVSF